MPVRNKLDRQHPALVNNQRIRVDNKASRVVEFRYGPGPCHTILRVWEHALDRFIQRTDDTIRQWWDGPLDDREHYVPVMFEVLKKAADDRVERRKNEWDVKYQRWRNWEFVVALKAIPTVKTCYPLDKG